MLTVGFALFQFRILGGGDAKLLAAGAIWVGLDAMTPFAYWTAIAGGGLAVFLVLARSFAMPHPYFPKFCNRLLEPGGGMPYGVAIFIGGVAAAPQLPIIANALTLP
jgi:prepilin peptidase CpaA